MTGNIYTIPASCSFIDGLTHTLLQETRDQPEALSRYLILLPTRRACRLLRDGFLKQTGGQCLILPRMQPIGDIDDEDISLRYGGLEAMDDIPSPISAMERKIYLSQLIAAIPNYQQDTQNTLKLADTLAHLMDQIYTEDLDLSLLPTLVDAEELADHWQITTNFLTILSDAWPKILLEKNKIDAADRRNRLIKALTHQWHNHPPDQPIIAAGSTGSIPATAALLKTVASLHHGRVILPGVDTDLDPSIWGTLEEGHPQYTLKIFLDQCGKKNTDIKTLYQGNHNPAIEKIISDIMLPSDAVSRWNIPDTHDIKNSIAGIQYYETPTDHDEAKLIALLIRETLETPGKTASLITPDRDLAKQVIALCHRWGLVIDDSAGQSLSQTPIGIFNTLLLDYAQSDFNPVSFLSLIKHPLFKINGIDGLNNTITKLDTDYLRGYNKYHTLHDLINDVADPEVADFLTQFSDALILLKQAKNFTECLDGHISALETLCYLNSVPSDHLDPLIGLISDFREHAASITLTTPQDYHEVFGHFLQKITIRPRYGMHPRVNILGQLEARLVQADRIIMSGLNEGTWPDAPDHDPWMSRQMRQKFGLPLPERSTSLAAHDFVQGFCQKEVFITRAKKKGSAATIPSRWIERLNTYLTAKGFTKGLSMTLLQSGPYLSYLADLDRHVNGEPMQRPAPCPPLSARPQKLSATKIETWVKDPYSIYARYILSLKPLDPIDAPFGAKERGILIHEIMEKIIDLDFTQDHAALDHHIQAITTATFLSFGIKEEDKISLMPKLSAIIDWIIPHEKEWRLHYTPKLIERFIEKDIDGFKIFAKPDRIDQSNDGYYAIIDYKTGGQYTQAKIQKGNLPQLPIEALIMSDTNPVSYLGYWVLTGKHNEAATKVEITHDNYIQESIDTIHEKLLSLIQLYRQENTDYICQPRSKYLPHFNDYTHLARIKEWAIHDNGEDTAS